MNPEHVKKIAILRANALGDFIVTLPAVKALRLAYPQAEIVLIGREWHKEYLVHGRCVVDRVVLAPILKNIRSEGDTAEDTEATAAFFAEMEREKFDIAFSFQGNGISAIPFIKRLKARITIGYACEESDKPDRWLPFYYYQNEILRYLEIVALSGAHNKEVEPEINVLKSDREEAESVMALLDSKPFIVLHPFATDLRRTWPQQNFTALADLLKDRGFEIVFTGSAKERSEVDEINRNMKSPGLNTCGDLSLNGLTALIANAALLIGSDTGPLHLARALKTQTVGIYWAPNLVNWGPLTRTLHRPVVSWELACPICGTVPNDPYPFEPRDKCEHLVSFVRNISVPQVLKEAEILLSNADVLHPVRKITENQNESGTVLKMIA